MTICEGINGFTKVKRIHFIPVISVRNSSSLKTCSKSARDSNVSDNVPSTSPTQASNLGGLGVCMCPHAQYGLVVGLGLLLSTLQVKIKIFKTHLHLPNQKPVNSEKCGQVKIVPIVYSLLGGTFRGMSTCFHCPVIYFYCHLLWQKKEIQVGRQQKKEVK